MAKNRKSKSRFNRPPPDTPGVVDASCTRSGRHFNEVPLPPPCAPPVLLSDEFPPNLMSKSANTNIISLHPLTSTCAISPPPPIPKDCLIDVIDNHPQNMPVSDTIFPPSPTVCSGGASMSRVGAAALVVPGSLGKLPPFGSTGSTHLRALGDEGLHVGDMSCPPYRLVESSDVNSAQLCDAVGRISNAGGDPFSVVSPGVWLLCLVTVLKLVVILHCLTVSGYCLEPAATCTYPLK